jgi:hypothetical protein
MKILPAILLLTFSLKASPPWKHPGGTSGAGQFLGGENLGALSGPASQNNYTGLQLNAIYANPWQIPGFIHRSASLFYDYKKYHAGLTFAKTNLDSIYRESNFALLLSRKFLSKMRGGLRYDFESYDYSGGLNEYRSYLSLGLQLQLFNNLRIGSGVNHWNMQSSSGYKDPLTRIYALGWQYTDLYEMDLELHDTGRDWELVCGQILKISKAIGLETGFRTEPFRASGGIHIRFGNYSSGASVQSHPQLNSSRSFWLSYQPN